MRTSNAYLHDHSASKLLVRAEITHHTACQAACHEGKPYEEEETCAPDGARVAKALFSAYTIIVDQVYDENAEERAQPGDPIREGDVHGYGIIWLVIWWVRVRREDSGIEECPKSKREPGGKGIVRTMGSVGGEGTERGKGR